MTDTTYEDVIQTAMHHMGYTTETRAIGNEVQVQVTGTHPNGITLFGEPTNQPFDQPFQFTADSYAENPSPMDIVKMLQAKIAEAQ